MIHHNRMFKRKKKKAGAGNTARKRENDDDIDETDPTVGRIRKRSRPTSTVSRPSVHVNIAESEPKYASDDLIQLRVASSLGNVPKNEKQRIFEVGDEDVVPIDDRFLQDLRTEMSRIDGVLATLGKVAIEQEFSPEKRIAELEKTVSRDVDILDAALSFRSFVTSWSGEALKSPIVRVNSRVTDEISALEKELSNAIVADGARRDETPLLRKSEGRSSASFSPPYDDVDNVFDSFRRFKEAAPDAYEKAFVGTSLADVVAPYVRAALAAAIDEGDARLLSKCVSGLNSLGPGYEERLKSICLDEEVAAHLARRIVRLNGQNHLVCLAPFAPRMGEAVAALADASCSSSFDDFCEAHSSKLPMLRTFNERRSVEALKKAFKGSIAATSIATRTSTIGKSFDSHLRFLKALERRVDEANVEELLLELCQACLETYRLPEHREALEALLERRHAA